MTVSPRDARAEAHARVRGVYDARVLEPSPPAVTEPPWLADDPVAVGERRGRQVVTPVTGADVTWDELAREDDDLRSWCADRWLGGWRRLPFPLDPEAFVSTRRTWHTLAEHVLAPVRHAANGKIGLRFTRSGFGTPYFRARNGVDEQARVEGTNLVVHRGETTQRKAITTVRRAATLAGIAPGAPVDLYAPTTELAPDTPLALDRQSVALLADWFGFAASVLEQLRAEASAEERRTTRVQLWPEHFDLSVELGDADAGGRGTFGASPGDDSHLEPYLYVTHWAPVAPDPFWNDATFGGASLSYADLAGAADQREAALAFLRRGRRRLARR